MVEQYDFSGWATRNDVLCSDGRTIRRDAFKDNDGKKVPLVWNHDHDNPSNVLGHAWLENRPEGVYMYGKFNDTKEGQHAKVMVQNGDIDQLSIYANQLKHNRKDGYYRDVLHGNIREVSLVLAGANPKAYIDTILRHGADLDSDEEGIMYFDNEIQLFHSDESEEVEEVEEVKEETRKEIPMDEEAKEKDKEEDVEHADKGEKTVEDVINSMSEEQKNVMYFLVGQASKGAIEEGGNEEMNQNIFEHDDREPDTVLSHADQMDIIKRAKSNSCGSLRDAMAEWAENNETLAHGYDDIEQLFPEYKDVRSGMPETLERDQGWVNSVISKTHKSPFSRIRTRQFDVRGEDLRAKGYQKKGNYKEVSGNIKLLKRTTDPQTVYRKDVLHRDDIVDITDFDVVNYQYGVMKQNLYEDIALAIMIGDGRDDGDPDKIYQEHIRAIWHDDELYAIHQDVNFTAAAAKLQGTNTSANFSENYIKAEAIIEQALYSREKYKGSGNLVFYCTPHLLNLMLLSRDLNGRRIYSSVNDIAAALNVTSIQTAEQFENKIRETKDGKKKKLLGIFVNLSDYDLGSTKGGELTRFSQFDIDFNQEKYLIETRLSGALTRPYSAIILEEPVE